MLALHLKRLFDNAGLPTTKPRDSALRAVTKEVVGLPVLHRTGVVTSLDKLTADHLSTLLNKVLYNSPYRDNARRMQKAIAEANGLSAAVDIIEQSLGERARSLANSV